MTKWQIAFQSFKYYLRTNLAVALGVAAATAVLTGALIVGDSMRHSLRALTLERLGQIDEMLVSDGFFRAKLADEIRTTKTFSAEYRDIAPAIMFPGGTVEHQPNDIARRAGQVTVLGIDEKFWSFENSTVPHKELVGETAIVNQALAEDLQISASDVESGSARITVRVPKLTQLPADSALGRKTDLIESLVDLRVVQIIPTEGLGRFGLHPTQTDPLNVFVPIKLLQDSLQRTVLKHKSDPAQANVLMISSQGDTPPAEKVSQQFRREIRPTLEDYGLTLKRVTQSFGTGDEAETIFDYWSLSTDQLVLTNEATASITKSFPDATPLFTYLANDLRKSDQKSGIPFSMIAAVNFGDSFGPTSAQSAVPVRQLTDNEIVLNQWAADDLEVEVGEKILVTYFEPETTHGSQVEKTVELTLVDVTPLTDPDRQFVVPRRGPIKPALFESRAPTIANDPDLTPEVPGVTDAESIENWDLPFQTADKIRPQDDDYWNNHRTTPKAFVSLATGQKLWHSRFGETTSFRIGAESNSAESIRERLLSQFIKDDTRLGMHLVSIKRRGLQASSGSTPFDVLFLALSMFVIGAALILVSLLFRLGLQQRASELGLMKAAGFSDKLIRNVWLSEMTIVSLIGAVIGVLLGIGYAWMMIWGLSTWWVGAISRPFLSLHVSGLSLVVGLLSGLVICVLTIAWSLRRTRNQPVRSLLAGQLETFGNISESKRRYGRLIGPLLVVAAVGLTGLATQLSGEAQAGSFMGAGFLILSALLMFVFHWLQQPGEPDSAGRLSLPRLAMLSAKRNPLRSTLTIGLVAVASFLIAAVSSFRLTPSESGTAGFDWVAQSSQPVFADLGSAKGQLDALGVGYELTPGTEVMSVRYKNGEDASCNNLYQSTQPRALGVSDRFIDSFDAEDATQFAWGGSLAKTEAEKRNPWRLLKSETRHAGTAVDPIPVMLDKNTANYSLKIYMLDTVKQVDYDTGETIHYRVVGFLANTILQGSLVMSEKDFENAFPSAAGYQYFLIRDGMAGSSADANVAVLEDRLGDQGFDARSAPQLLSNFMAVQNTYLSTFQTLGALGLLLGTFGLAAVQIRSVLERKQELGLMRAVGFAQSKLSRMVLMENAWLLFMGLAVGITAALFTTVPHWFVGTASVPWLTLATMFAGIVVVGLVAGSLASRVISRTPLLQSLRS